MLYFKLVRRPADEANFLPSQAHEVIRCQFATGKVITGYGTILLFWLGNTPDNERRIHLEQRFYMHLLTCGGHQDKPVHTTGIEVLMRPIRLLRVHMDDKQVVSLSGKAAGDAAQDLEAKQICYREVLVISMGDKANRPAFLHAELAGRGVDLEVMLTGQIANLSLGLHADQWTVVQSPRYCGFGNPS